MPASRKLPPNEPVRPCDAVCCGGAADTYVCCDRQRPRPVRHGPTGSFSFNFRDVIAQLDFLLAGVQLTLLLSAVTMALGLLIGVAGAAARSWGGGPLRWIATVYVETIRNTPLLIQLFIVFFGLPGLGIRF